MKKAIAIHTVAANGGDQLLLMALKQGLFDYCNTDIGLTTTNSSINYSFIPTQVCLNQDLISYNHIRSYKLKTIAKKFFLLTRLSELS